MQSIHDNGKSLAQNTRVVVVFMLKSCNIYVVLQYCVRHEGGAYASRSVLKIVQAPATPCAADARRRWRRGQGDDRSSLGRI